MRLGGPVLGIALFVTACGPAAPRGLETHGARCPRVRVLAAAGPENLIHATQCAERVRYLGNVYEVGGCFPIHELRVGETLADGGGETSYSGVLALKGVPPEHAIVLTGGPDPGCLALARTREGRKADLGDLTQPPGVELAVSASRVSPGHTVLISLKASERYVYGPAFDLLRVGTRGDPVDAPAAVLVEKVRGTKLVTRSPARILGLPPPLLSGERTWTWRIPHIPRGRYVLRKALRMLEAPKRPTVYATLEIRINR